eukprot:scaffold631_cov338-Pinguiococcus_pyrenoidosus.AAC.1
MNVASDRLVSDSRHRHVRYDGSDGFTENLRLSDCPCQSSEYMGRLTDLLAWHAADPVDAAEIARTDTICRDFQGNRNPFIDHPSLVSQLFDAPAPCACTTCSASRDGQCVSTQTPAPVSAPASPPSPVGPAPPTPAGCGALRPGDLMIVGQTSDNPDT